MFKKIILFIILAVFTPLFCFGNVVINEIMIGQTKAVKNEFIELYNPTENSIDLTKYKLRKKTSSGEESNLVSSSKFVGIIPAYGYFLITHPDYKDIIDADLVYSGSSYSISSNNTVILYDQENNIIDKVGYGGKASDFENQASPEPKNNQSIEREPIGYDSDNNSLDFIIRDIPSPQNSHSQKLPLVEEPETVEQEVEQELEITISSEQTVPISTVSNHPPIADAGPDITALVNQEIIFDASQSLDPDNDELTFFWNFGDGATDDKKESFHSYLYPGQYIIVLSVSDNELFGTDTLIVNIFNKSITINEFMPKQGWIELFNQTNQISNLTGWQLAVNNKSFAFPENSLIGPKQFLVLRSELTRLEFGNKGELKLFYPDSSLASQIDYSTKDEEAIAFDGQEYFLTKIATAGFLNLIDNKEIAEKENLAPNNPSLIVQPVGQTDKISLNQGESFVAEDRETEKDNLLTQQSASLIQTTKNNQKNKLILIISIIISSSLLISWLLILLKRK